MSQLLALHFTVSSILTKVPLVLDTCFVEKRVRGSIYTQAAAESVSQAVVAPWSSGEVRKRYVGKSVYY